MTVSELIHQLEHESSSPNAEVKVSISMQNLVSELDRHLNAVPGPDMESDVWITTGYVFTVAKDTVLLNLP
jgi:hypothetical protein